MIKVFLSSAYTKGRMNNNLFEHFDMGNKLIDAGFAPFIPLLNHYMEIHKLRDDKTWLSIDLEWLAQSDAVLRIPGDSDGADGEVARAEELGIPVFYTLESLIEHYKKQLQWITQ